MYHVEIRYGLEDILPASLNGEDELFRQELSFHSPQCSELVRCDGWVVEDCEVEVIVGKQGNRALSLRCIVVSACCYRWLWDDPLTGKLLLVEEGALRLLS